MALFGDSVTITGIQNIFGTKTIIPPSSSEIGLILKALAGQSNNLLEIRDSFNVLKGYVQPDGGLGGISLHTLNNGVIVYEENSGGGIYVGKSTAQAASPGTNVLKLYVRDGTNANTLKLVVRAGNAGAEITLLDNIPQ